MLFRRAILSFFVLAGALLSTDEPKTREDNVLPQEWPSSRNIAVASLWQPSPLTLPAGPVKEAKQAITSSSFVDITTILEICHADTSVAEHGRFIPVKQQIAPPVAEEEPPKDSSDPGPAVKDMPRWITRLRYLIRMIKNSKILTCLELGFS
ncbi:hypothetical protein FRC03_012720, partial [Tulasnella sp. 419]